MSRGGGGDCDGRSDSQQWRPLLLRLVWIAVSDSMQLDKVVEHEGEQLKGEIGRAHFWARAPAAR